MKKIILLSIAGIAMAGCQASPQVNNSTAAPPPYVAPPEYETFSVGDDNFSLPDNQPVKVTVDRKTGA